MLLVEEMRSAHEKRLDDHLMYAAFWEPSTRVHSETPIERMMRVQRISSAEGCWYSTCRHQSPSRLLHVGAFDVNGRLETWNSSETYAKRG